jgi:formylglycine-generating enzyme required for sulfatase activity
MRPLVLLPPPLVFAFVSPPLVVAALLIACNSVPPSPSHTRITPHEATVKENPQGPAIISVDAGLEELAPTSQFAPDSSTQAESGPLLRASIPGMLLVAGGEFTMGADDGGQEDEKPAHKVRLAAFYLDQLETTHAEYAECVSAGKCRAPDAKTLERFRAHFVTPQRPVSGISWDDARAYCTYKGKRLPREAEFERAVRGDDGRKYTWGNATPTPEHTVFQTSKTAEVGTHPMGRGPYGHDDLAGNVWEWMEDAYDPFAYRREGAADGKPGTCEQIVRAQDELRKQGREGFTGSNPIPTVCERSIRGGAYNYDAHGLRSTNRVHHPGTYHLLMTGVRCARGV